MGNVKTAQIRQLRSPGDLGGLRIRLLGPVAVSIDGKAVSIASRRARALLGYLVLRNGTEISRSVLTGLLWGERSESQARASLRQALSELRAALAGSEPQPITASKETIGWNAGSAWIDASIVAAASSIEDEEALRNAAGLIGGELMEGLSVDEPGFDEWLRGEREQFRLIACGIHARLMERAERSGRWEEALTSGLKLLSLDRLQEHVHRALMRIYTAQGRHDAALAQYERCCRELSSELGVRPDRETEELARSIRANRRDRTAPARGAAAIAPEVRQHERLPLPDRPSIAVLPFTNMSGDPDQEFFSDGITEDIITELSRNKSLFVVARNSSFVFRGRAVDIRGVGKALGVRVVLEGSVRKAGNRIRVTAQLIDATSGEHLWADRYDGDLVDVFSLQEEISRTIVSTIADRLEDSGADRLTGRPTGDLNAYEQVLRGQKYLHRYSKEDYDLARICFESAISSDPTFARAYGFLAMVEAYGSFWDDEPSRLDRAVGIGESGLALDQHESKCHLALGLAHLFRAAHDKAGYHLSRGSELNPNDDLIMVESGRYQMYVGRPQEGAELVRRAMRRNPYHPNWYWNILGRCLHTAEAFEEAIPVFERITTAQFWTHAYLAACHAALGHSGEAAEQVGKTMALKPEFTVSTFSRFLPYRNTADLERFLESLRRSGLPK